MLTFCHPRLLCVLQRIWRPQPEERRKTGNQEDRLAVAVTMRSVNNNKTTVCPIVIPRKVSRHGKATTRSRRSPSVKTDIEDS